MLNHCERLAHGEGAGLAKEKQDSDQQPEIADDPIEAKVSGRGRLAVQIKHMAQLLDELGSVCVRIDAGGSAGSAILVTDPDDANFTIVQMPYLWSAQASQAA